MRIEAPIYIYICRGSGWVGLEKFTCFAGWVGLETYYSLWVGLVEITCYMGWVRLG